MARTREVVIIGAGGHGREMLDIVEARAENGEPIRCRGFLDDGMPDTARLHRRGHDHLGDVGLLAQLRVPYIIGVGDPSVRCLIDGRCRDLGAEPTDLVHPATVLGGDTSWGPGSVLCANATITTNVRLGRHVHVNINATIAHDCVVGDFVTVNPGANISGDVTIGDRVMVGTGAAIIQGVRIGEGATIGAGAVVTRDVEPGVTAVGVPARPLVRSA